jgi:uncharacterized protein (DUF2141 family)
MDKDFDIRKIAVGGGRFLPFCLLTLLLLGCARMGNPDGGWYDEKPPRVIGCSPEDQATNVKSKHIYINFDEFIKIDNPTENVVVSPPQLEAPEIKGQGKRISVHLLDSLKPNTTYTIDFSNAISDNNEDNPMGNYTYSFSTGDHIDTMEVAGYVLQANDLEPVKGILVGLYKDLSDTAFTHKPMMRVSRTDSRGHFVIKGVAQDMYHVYALKDMDGDYIRGQKGEMMAFSHDVVVPMFRADVRQDTVWSDSIHIKSISRVPYTHYLPDDICLRAFDEVLTTRYLIKSERKEANCFSLFYSYGDTELPQLRGLNFNAANAFLVDATARRDTITYWLRDSALINQDTLQVEVKHHISDSLGVLRMQTDTLKLLSKQPYEKRMKQQQKEFETWQKAEEKKKRKGEPYDSVMPVTPLSLDIKPGGEMDPDENVSITAQEPLTDIDTTHVHLFSKPAKDTLWYHEPYELTRVRPTEYRLRASWRPGTEYSLEIDSAAVATIYGKVADRIKQGLKVKDEDSYGTLLVTLSKFKDKQVIGELLDGSDKVVKRVIGTEGQLEFYYLHEGKYYLRLIVDENRNGQWDTGEYATDRQPEEVYYYPEEVECKAKWDITRTWDPTSLPLYRQKPGAITKQKAEKQKTVQHRNAERARQQGIDLPPELQ